MLRGLVVLLLLAVFFMSGMLMGIDRGQSGQGIASVEMSDDGGDFAKEKSAKENDENVVIEERVINEAVTDAEEPVHFTQEIAAFAEMLVKGFYEAVVAVIYQAVQLFY